MSRLTMADMLSRSGPMAKQWTKKKAAQTSPMHVPPEKPKAKPGKRAAAKLHDNPRSKQEE